MSPSPSLSRKTGIEKEAISVRYEEFLTNVMKGKPKSRGAICFFFLSKISFYIAGIFPLIFLAAPRTSVRSLLFLKDMEHSVSNNLLVIYVHLNATTYAPYVENKMGDGDQIGIVRDGIKTVPVVSRSVIKGPVPDGVLVLDCEDKDLSCRLFESYADFISYKEVFGWLLLVDANVFINYGILNEFLTRMTQNPWFYSVFRAQYITDGDDPGFVGGAGWLMSAKFVENHVRRGYQKMSPVTLRKEYDFAKQFIRNETYFKERRMVGYKQRVTADVSCGNKFAYHVVDIVTTTSPEIDKVWKEKDFDKFVQIDEERRVFRICWD